MTRSVAPRATKPIFPSFRISASSDRLTISVCTASSAGCGVSGRGNWESSTDTSAYSLRQRNCSMAASFLRWSALSASSLSSFTISKLTSLMTAPSVPLPASIVNSMKLPLKRLHRATGQCALPFLSPAPTTVTLYSSVKSLSSTLVKNVLSRLWIAISKWLVVKCVSQGETCPLTSMAILLGICLMCKCT